VIRVGSLFSGLEAIALGLRLAGVNLELAWVADNDPAASKVLAHHYPHVTNLGDVTEVDWAEIEPPDLLVGGFPCQDLSLAGLGRGIAAGTRSGLWIEFARAINNLRPRLVLIENVRGLLSARADSDVEPCPHCVGDRHWNPKQPALRALGAVCGDLADLGYDARWVTVSAASVGAAHKRERVFILATPADAEGDPRRILFGDHVPAGSSAAASSGMTLLPTPRTSDANGAGQHGDGGPDLRTTIAMLPTPRATDGTHGGPNQRGSKGDLMLPSAVALLPTPTVADSRGTRNATANRTPGHEAHDGWTLGDVAYADRWGEYAPAIAQWERIFGTASPEPTEPGENGPRLAAKFDEWLMGISAGHVTEVPGLSRNDMLRLLGNAPVPHQVAAATWELVSVA